MAAAPPSYFETHHLAFEASTGQVLQALRRDDEDGPHAYDVYLDSSYDKGDAALLAQALRDLRLPEREAHLRATQQLRKLTATLPRKLPLRAVASYFLGMCYVEGRGTAKRCVAMIMS